MWTHVAEKSIPVWKLMRFDFKLITARCEIPPGAKYYLESDSKYDLSTKSYVSNQLNILAMGIWKLQNDTAKFVVVDEISECLTFAGINDVIYKIGLVKKVTGLWQPVWVAFGRLIRNVVVDGETFHWNCDITRNKSVDRIAKYILVLIDDINS